jgi:hypothetical protein
MRTNPNAGQGFAVLEEVQQNLLKTMEQGGLAKQIPANFKDSVPSSQNNYRIFVSRNKPEAYVLGALKNTESKLSSSVFIDLLNKYGNNPSVWAELKRLIPATKAEVANLRAAASLPANAGKKQLFDEAIKIGAAQSLMSHPLKKN